MEETVVDTSIDIVSIMRAAMENVSADILDMVAMALPIALGISGVFMAIRFGWGFFRSLAH